MGDPEFRSTTAGDEARIGDRWPVLAALMLAAMVIMLDNSVLNVALPTIGSALQAGTAELQWVVTAYSLTFGGLLLTTGNLADRLGRKRVLAVGLSVMAAGSLLVLLAQSATALALIRALIGVGAALAMPSTLSLIYSTFTGAARLKAAGLWSAVTMLGFVVGPVLAGVMLTHLAWQWLFLINVPVAVVAVPVILAVIPESREATGERVDLAGAVLSVGFLAALIYALSSGPDAGWLSLPVLGSFAGAALLLLVFCGRELTAAQPMLDLRQVASRQFAVPAVVEATAFLAVSSVLFIQTQLVQLVLGYTPLQAGLLSLPPVIVMVAGNSLVARLGTRVPARFMIAGGLTVVASGTLLIALWPTSVVAIVAGMSVIMVGVRAALTTVAIEVINALPRERMGMGSALNDTFQEIGGAIGVALLGALLNQAYRSALPADAPASVLASLAAAAADPVWVARAQAAFAHGASVALGAGAALMLLVGLAAALLHRPAPDRPDADAQPPAEGKEAAASAVTADGTVPSHPGQARRDP
ncbi:MFS transporter [Propionicimonas sp.]|uniref:MFS transporter n=1 Tax=Propionicimonas sp. TaxID=1955623 RepID=UPI0039E3B6B5